jgi:hypothetical protein
VDLALRKKQLAFGLLFAFLPMVLWAAILLLLVLKISISIRAHERLVE